MGKKYPFVVIGAGAAGLVVANGLAKAGKKVLLIEKGLFGGDCTNFGCIPSKTLIASAQKGEAIKQGALFGIEIENSHFDADKALERVRKTIEQVRSTEDPQALKTLGVETLTGTASFESPHELKVEEINGEIHQISAKKIVIATGSYPFIPPIPGLKNSPFYTNETIFNLKKIPENFTVLGAGPIGCELAQAFSRLGSRVTIIESARGIMPNEDADVQELMKKILTKENIQIHTKCETDEISYENGEFSICILNNGEKVKLKSEALLVATGRRPTIKELNLEKGEITHSEKGIPIDSYGRTNQKHIFAIGDVVGGPLFTHYAENQGRTVLTSLLLPSPFLKKLDRFQAVPHCTFTDPEVAGFGLSEEKAMKKYGKKKIAIYKAFFSENDRAITTNQTEGFIKIITKKWSSQILGATIVAPRAGEMLPELSLAMLHRIPLRKLTRLIHPYPTYNGAIRKAADLWLTQTIIPLFFKGKKS